MLRELPSQPIPEASKQSHSQGKRLSVLGLEPTSSGSCMTPHSPDHTRILHQFHPSFPMAQSQMAHSIKPFTPGVVTQKQFELVPLKRYPLQKSTWAFISCLPMQRSPGYQLLPPSSCPSTSLCYWTPTSFAVQEVDSSQFCVSQCPFTWLVSPIFLPFVIPEVGSSRPLVLG